MGVHLALMTSYGKSTFGVPFNAAPDHRPYYANIEHDHAPQYWNRLIVSRWDTGQYVGIGLRGYMNCPKHADLRQADLRAINENCNLNFYPGYSFLGWLVSFGNHFPIDYALLVVTLLSSFAFLYMWTGPTMTGALGVWGAYCSLILFNAYTTGFTLVTLQTEPTLLACMLGSLICLEKRRFFAAAVLAGVASAMRINGACASVALGVALLVETYRNRPDTLGAWAWRGVTIAVGGAGIVGYMAYYQWRFHDALIYSHMHAATFGHSPKLWHAFFPKVEWVSSSFTSVNHEIVFVMAALLWFALGRKEGLKGFTPLGRAFLYVQFGLSMFISMFGSAEMAYAGCNRYTLTVIALFFAMAGVLKNRPLALSLWLIASGWHYWNVDVCFYEAHLSPMGMSKCQPR